MCGIVAILPACGQVSAPALMRATAALRHRGPDGEQTWVSPDGRVGLGHTLLAINDPEGTQPIASEDDRLRIIVNGEFYDFARIRASLQARGHRFSTRSDSEIALHLYEDLGAGCLEQLRGQFALVLWDAATKTIFAARDRFGLKPLFYAEHNGTLYLASEAKALFAAGVPASWDLRAVHHSLHACPDERRSLFAGVRQVPPGHFLRAQNGNVRLERYWDLPHSRRTRRGLRTKKSPSFKDAVARVRELTEEAVGLRMDAGVPVGCLLSGGLDSSAVLGAAAHAVRNKVAAFTVGFERREYDESDGAREMAEAVGADHKVVMLGDSHLADHFAEAVWHAETFQYNTHGVARYLLAQRVRGAGYRSVMAGEGADEAFFGYEFLRAAAGITPGAEPGVGAPRGARTRRLARLARGSVRAVLQSPARHNPAVHSVSPWLARLMLLLPAAPALLNRLTRGLGLIQSVCSEDFRRGFTGYDLYREFYLRCRKTTAVSRREPARQLLYLWLHSIFVNYHLAADRLDMAHGVEVRLPFLDHKLFEYANQLPIPLLTTPPREKHLLREAMRPHLPDSVYGRAKRPFMAPSAVGTGGPLHDFLQDALRGDAMRSVPFFDHGEIVDILDRLPKLPPEDRPSVDSLLLILASTSVLQDRYRL